MAFVPPLPTFGNVNKKKLDFYYPQKSVTEILQENPSSNQPTKKNHTWDIIKDSRRNPSLTIIGSYSNIPPIKEIHARILTHIEINDKIQKAYENCLKEPNSLRFSLDYFDVLSDFVSIEIIRLSKRVPTCPTCCCELEYIDAVEMNEMIGEQESTPAGASAAALAICRMCKVARMDSTPIMNHNSSSGGTLGLGGTLSCSSNGGGGDGDGERAVVSDHCPYDDRDNFTKTWQAYHGMHNPKIPPDLFDRLDTFFVMNGLKTGEEYRAMPVVKNRYNEEIKAGTSVEWLSRALKELSIPLYIDQFYIRHVYWGWPLPNQLHLQEIVFKNYDRTQAVNKHIKKKRHSALNAWYRLYQELKGAGAGPEVHIHTFNLVTTEKIRVEHDEIREDMCRLASLDGGPPIKFFSTEL